jgi:hypothetical protein
VSLLFCHILHGQNISSDYWVASVIERGNEPYYVDFKNNKAYTFDRKILTYNLRITKKGNKWQKLNCYKYNSSNNPLICGMAGRCDTTFVPIDATQNILEIRKKQFNRVCYDEYFDDLQLIEANLAKKNTQKDIKSSFERFFKTVPFVGMNEAEARKALWFINSYVKLGHNNGFYLWIFEINLPNNSIATCKLLFKGKNIVAVKI